jgi:PTH2 family peptidyl-tRNA hydrolase
MEYKLVVVVRSDLRLSQGKLAVQVAHAAVNCALACRKSEPKWFKAWYDEGQRKVAVKVDSLGELRDLQMQAKSAGLPHSLVQDAGLTEVPPGTITCLGIGPGPEKIIDKLTGSLSLV